MIIEREMPKAADPDMRFQVGENVPRWSLRLNGTQIVFHLRGWGRTFEAAYRRARLSPPDRNSDSNMTQSENVLIIPNPATLREVRPPAGKSIDQKIHELYRR